ncbi:MULTISPECIES: YggS family pyridoxal phosphate-dependent enzyme [Shewanella]|uniref:Pyridoxal phosphate homeostasis protein n=1 Tax=Shewanella fidelis TaxID=173509 RepID=A0AAW8NQR6_9GAMM|nr:MULTISPECIES: YggS family pyridoxal phosphate-dependent enzyme [Shewanella]MDR8524690.1 YggS family pyridoxal phosphate-dependent enzyme [Shewanella fidelis]MDW4812165.1 YggS family pyridoxal phosphate-dependent enzyme [Shewanella fidelis]MDW4817380.1 YggS family pyridoxal phosphate-dependent enzyme [Shewanella fidelis]MDW4821447.1 YggS family pyridoxal phosphate-dependent enzyme [Shewanella fidelis]MDW4822772.1 YggS family pyridoxal phosphate-dependent enzyme [Shewanella fidelis]
MTTITDRLAIAQHRITQAAQNASRRPQDVQLLAVSKTKPNEYIIEAYQAGQRRFGENYVQEGETKINALSQDYPDIEWHFIGPLQSNKTKVVASLFDWMHTVDREKIAQRLNDQRPDGKPALNICIQVNISLEESKSGALAADVLELADKVALLPNIKLRGLMAIPSADVDEQTASAELAALQALFNQLAERHSSVDTLSVGMSNDLELAVNHGSTMVRIGSAIFGERDYSKA